MNVVGQHEDVANTVDLYIADSFSFGYLDCLLGHDLLLLMRDSNQLFIEEWADQKLTPAPAAENSEA